MAFVRARKVIKNNNNEENNIRSEVTSCVTKKRLCLGTCLYHVPNLHLGDPRMARMCRTIPILS